MSVFTPLDVEQALKLVNRWFDETAERFNPLTTENRSDNPLRAADYALTINVEQRRVTLDSAGKQPETDPAEWHGELSPHEANAVWCPQLTARIEQRLQTLAQQTSFSYYRFTVIARFATREGLLQQTLIEVVDKEKVEQLRRAMVHYQQEILEQGRAPTDEHSTLFYCGNALNAELFPQPDISALLRGCRCIETLNRGNTALSAHRRWIVYHLSQWVETQFLPRYFSVTKSAWGERHYHLKPDAELFVDVQTGDQPIDLLLYVAVLILRFEPSYSKPAGLDYLQLAQQLGCEKAERYLREGSGALAAEDIALDNPQLCCVANDVLAQVTIHIREESAGAYQQAVTFIQHLLEQGFPRHYRIKLKSAVKTWLPVKGLARSDTQRLFANALRYPELHPLLERYARIAIEQYEWYADTEGEKCCLPGTYAVFGLALSDERYFPLLQHYMSQVDEEHQSTQDGFIKAFVEHFPLDERTIPPLVACLCKATEALKLRIAPQLEDEQTLRLLAACITPLPEYSAEHVLFLLWGKRDKVAALAKKASGEKQELYRALLCAAGNA